MLERQLYIGCATMVHINMEDRPMDIIRYDRPTWIPLIKGSMCNGTQRAGFRNTETGRFEEICKLDTPRDLRQFMEQYDLSKSDLTREW